MHDHNVVSSGVIIAGGVPAGLTAAYELTKYDSPCIVLEADKELVGGISPTDKYRDYWFDIGEHRFFSKSDEVNQIWRVLLGDELKWSPLNPIR
jgi:protoporphyrinogen oxidase